MIPTEKRDHKIERKHADDLILAHRTFRPTLEGESGTHGGSFHADQVQALLTQPGAAFLHVAYALRGGERTLILSALREDMSTITDLTLDYHFPCPPFCP